MTSAKFATLKLSAVCLIGMAAGGLSPAASAAAAGPYQGEATLAAAAASPTDKDIDGVNWHCDGEKCVGKAERHSSLDSYMKECRKVAGALGKLTRFYSRGREMSQRDLDNCNRAAAQ